MGIAPAVHSKTMQKMLRRLFVCILLITTLACVVAKNYQVSSIESHTFLTPESLQTCGWGVEEIITYEFTGQYSRFGRSIPRPTYNSKLYVSAFNDSLSTSLSIGYQMMSSIRILVRFCGDLLDTCHTSK